MDNQREINQSSTTISLEKGCQMEIGKLKPYGIGFYLWKYTYQDRQDILKNIKEHDSQKNIQ